MGKFNYFVDGSYDHNSLGVENPTAGSSTAVHGHTEQFKTSVRVLCVRPVQPAYDDGERLL